MYFIEALDVLLDCIPHAHRQLLTLLIQLMKQICQLIIQLLHGNLGAFLIEDFVVAPDNFILFLKIFMELGVVGVEVVNAVIKEAPLLLNIINCRQRIYQLSNIFYFNVVYF